MAENKTKKKQQPRQGRGGPASRNYYSFIYFYAPAYNPVWCFRCPLCSATTKLPPVGSHYYDSRLRALDPDCCCGSLLECRACAMCAWATELKNKSSPGGLQNTTNRKRSSLGFRCITMMLSDPATARGSVCQGASTCSFARIQRTSLWWHKTQVPQHTCALLHTVLR